MTDAEPHVTVRLPRSVVRQMDALIENGHVDHTRESLVLKFVQCGLNAFSYNQRTKKKGSQ